MPRWFAIPDAWKWFALVKPPVPCPLIGTEATSADGVEFRLFAPFQCLAGRPRATIVPGPSGCPVKKVNAASPVPR